MKSGFNILLLIAFASVSLWCTGGLMRKNDQAVILAGAYDLASGQAQAPEAYYQVDKTYVVYVVCAAIIKLSRLIGNLVSPIVVCNAGLAFLFWASLTCFIVRFRQRLSPLVLLCVLAAPAVLLNTLYVNSTVLSSAFLLLSASRVFREGRRGSWIAAGLFFLAVGSRADVLLLLPLILWLITPFPMIETFFSEFSKDWKNGLRGLVVFSRHWKFIGSGALALLVGRLVDSVGGTLFDPIFNWKMVAGYTVFGFGAAGFLFILYAACLAVQAAKKQARLEKLYGFAGLAAFLLPVLFFIPQLHAPRYFWRGCEAVLLLAVTGRLPTFSSRTWKTGVCAAALVPLFIGIEMPVWMQPRLTLTEPTLFPSGDGVYPMGAYVPFLFRMRAAEQTPLDHNQRVWQTVRQARFQCSADGTVPVLYTPMSGYLLFSASLQDKRAVRASRQKFSGAAFYADSRSLMRDDPKSPLKSLNQMLLRPARFVSPVSAGIGILRFGEGDLMWCRQTRLLNRLFAGNEYRIYSADTVGRENRKTIWFSETPFDGAQRDADTGFFWSRVPPKDKTRPASRAEAVWPGWMSMQAFRGHDQ